MPAEAIRRAAPAPPSTLNADVERAMAADTDVKPATHELTPGVGPDRRFDPTVLEGTVQLPEKGDRPRRRAAPVAAAAGLVVLAAALLVTRPWERDGSGSESRPEPDAHREQRPGGQATVAFNALPWARLKLRAARRRGRARPPHAS